MSIHRLIRIAAFAALCAISVISTGSFARASEPTLRSLEGTWIMAAAYEILANGKRTTNYGEHPQGLFIVDKSGRYSMQIFRPGRLKFASGVKASGTAEEYRDAIVGSSTHTGRVEIDVAQAKLIFNIESSSFPNWEGIRQVRDFAFKDGTLTYSVPASASGNGTIAYSIWQRAQP
jgi:Lipocalin-like domain